MAFGLTLQHLLVAERIERGLGHMRPVGHHHEPQPLRQIGQQRLDQRHECQIEKQHPVARMADDVKQLFRDRRGLIV